MDVSLHAAMTNDEMASASNTSGRRDMGDSWVWEIRQEGIDSAHRRVAV
jgi:hypothetical protein